MALEIKMPALSPTMEMGTLSKWLIKVGDQVNSGDVMAEIETDKATMEFEAVDEGVVSELLVAEGSEDVKVGTVIARLTEEGEAAQSAKLIPSPPAVEAAVAKEAAGEGAHNAQESQPPSLAAPKAAPPPPVGRAGNSARVLASPLAKRIAAADDIDLAKITGSGPYGRIVKADLAGANTQLRQAQPQWEEPSARATETSEPVEKQIQLQEPSAAVAAPVMTAAPNIPATPAPATDPSTPHEVVKLSGMRKVIARRLTESKQQVPHIYLTVDIRLDALLKLRAELNSALTGRHIKLSVNDMLIKALGTALVQVPSCNVSFAGDNMLQFTRADISVAVSIPGGLITPIITDAGAKSVSAISTAMHDLGKRAKEGKLQPHEYQGGTASLSNMGMMGIKQFEAVINPPQGMIMAIGAGEVRPHVVDGALAIATVMTATGSFDHRAIDGADGAMLMKVFKELVESPLGLVA